MIAEQFSIADIASERGHALLRTGTYFASARCRTGSNPDPRSSFMHNDGGHIVETAIEARAGFLDRRTLAVLIVSTSLVIGLLALTYFFAG